MRYIQVKTSNFNSDKKCPYCSSIPTSANNNNILKISNNFLRLSNLTKILKGRVFCELSKNIQAKLDKISEISIKRMQNIDKNQQKRMLTTCTTKLHRYLRVIQHFLAFYKSGFSKISTHTPQTHFYYIF